MTHNDYTKNILNIKDENVYFLENCLETKIIKGVETKIFHGILTYTPDYCSNCGCINENGNDITLNTTYRVGTKMKAKLIISGIVNDEVTIVVRGDLNGDGYVTSVDTSRLKSAIKNAESERYTVLAGDTNQDSYLTSVDLSMIKQYISDPNSVNLNEN